MWVQTLLGVVQLYWACSDIATPCVRSIPASCHTRKLAVDLGAHTHNLPGGVDDSNRS